ncbi:MAG TPA: EAL domain-containing protein [Gaiellaceae bacterium]|jgi:EAL domain-containing protein (putative c-di-GMP-specific phosphodiesterase class I)/CheY-like chemotaxis protein|nr:EAL domain-containing protein [Gaiellaceae bacterium]
MSRLRVLIAEDDVEVRNALSELIGGEPDLEVIGAVGDALAAIEFAAEHRPDVVLLDVNMPGGGGKAAAKGIRRRSPLTKLIALTGHDDRSTVFGMLQAGVLGYLVKGGPVDEIIEAIKRAPEGRGSLSLEVTADVIQELAGELSARYRTNERRRLHERRIRRALVDDQALGMAYQPIVCLTDRKVVGAEALARFAGPPKRGPSLWFEEAKQVGLAEELELHAVRKAVSALGQIPEDAYLTVNVSPGTLARNGFHKVVSELDGSRLIAEVTEHAPIQDYDRLGEAVGRLRGMGVRLAIDDAGAGFASLRHILRLNPDLIKLDLTLIRDIHRDQSKRALAAGMISFAREIDVTIVAEGIERAAEAKTLIELGVNEGQGYYLGRPGPLPLGDQH